MSQITKFDQSMFAPVQITPGQALQSFASAPDAVKNALAGIDTQGLFPALSFKGGAFNVRREDEQVPLLAPQGYASPMVHVVMAHVSPEVRKSLYGTKYVEGSRELPKCFSYDGVTPSGGSELQDSVCSRCKHNQFGSREGGAGKACSDHKYVLCYVMDPKTGAYLLADDGSPMLFEFRVAGGSFGALRDYFKGSLAQLGLTYYEVITTISAVAGEQGRVKFELAGRIAPAFVKYIENERATNVKVLEFINQAKPGSQKPVIAAPQAALPVAQAPVVPAAPVAPAPVAAAPAMPAMPAMPSLPPMPAAMPAAPAPVAQAPVASAPAMPAMPPIKGIPANPAVVSRAPAASVDPVGPATASLLDDLNDFPEE